MYQGITIKTYNFDDNDAKMIHGILFATLSNYETIQVVKKSFEIDFLKFKTIVFCRNYTTPYSKFLKCF